MTFIMVLRSTKILLPSIVNSTGPAPSCWLETIKPRPVSSISSKTHLTTAGEFRKFDVSLVGSILGGEDGGAGGLGRFIKLHFLAESFHLYPTRKTEMGGRLAPNPPLATDGFVLIPAIPQMTTAGRADAPTIADSAPLAFGTNGGIAQVHCGYLVFLP